MHLSTLLLLLASISPSSSLLLPPQVNGKSSSFTEVTALLKGKGIDLDNNRFLILQGEVELISQVRLCATGVAPLSSAHPSSPRLVPLQMKPKAPSPHEDGLLEYLEDIIGSNTYVERIAEQVRGVAYVEEAERDRAYAPSKQPTLDSPFGVTG